MNDMCGIDPRFRSPLQGFGIISQPNPGALPRVVVECPFGALEFSADGASYVSISANGATYDSLGHRPRTHAPHIPQALKGRHNA